MKKIAVIALAAAFILSAVPSFMAAGYADQGQGDEKSLFQKWADCINTPVEMEVKPLKEVNTFQHMSDGIEEGSRKAKQTSLRTEKVK